MSAEAVRAWRAKKKDSPKQTVHQSIEKPEKQSSARTPDPITEFLEAEDAVQVDQVDQVDTFQGLTARSPNTEFYTPAAEGNTAEENTAEKTTAEEHTVEENTAQPIVVEDTRSEVERSHHSRDRSTSPLFVSPGPPAGLPRFGADGATQEVPETQSAVSQPPRLGQRADRYGSPRRRARTGRASPISSYLFESIPKNPVPSQYLLPDDALGLSSESDFTSDSDSADESAYGDASESLQRPVSEAAHNNRQIDEVAETPSAELNNRETQANCIEQQEAGHSTAHISSHTVNVHSSITEQFSSRNEPDRSEITGIQLPESPMSPLTSF